MQPKIGDKLDFLMRVTDTQNSTLGRALNFDASYISRIRAGSRGLPKHRPFIDEAAGFFARHVEDSIQQNLMSEIVCGGKRWPRDKEKAARLIAAWLRDENAPGPEDSFRMDPVSPDRPEPDTDIRLYYGNEGKREAVLRFLEDLRGEKKPLRLMLYSDEDMRWLYEDADFARHWAALLSELLERKFTIRIIHTIGRDIGDMIEALQKWMPLYLRGGIEPYYCPKLRDGVFRQTRFIAEGKAALVSDSVGEATGDMLNMLTTDSRAVRAFEQEFEAFFALCRPLMRCYSATEKEKQQEAILDFMARDRFVIAANPRTALPDKDSTEDPLARLADSPGFSRRILSPELPPGCILLSAEDGEAIVLGAGAPAVMFRIQEPTLSESIWEYLQRLK